MKHKALKLENLIPLRMFAIAFIDGQTPVSLVNSLDDLLEDSNDEYKYAIHERMDEVIMLKEGERLAMFFNRDNSADSTGFIKRIN